MRKIEDNYHKLDNAIETVLDAYKDDQVTKIQAREKLAHVFTALLDGNKEEFATFLDCGMGNK